ncbi:hypothetical protein [Flavobacterium sp.]|jgi:hypothetical protein|uniref:hypothetical protein n=1 Tax=Flavobacterium sp. TaxID=239 RepID=UPI002A81B88F|nr:hypothetical protein [Flavobacterium sp.]
MKKIILVVFFLGQLTISCESDVYKTKSGEYASVEGNFIAKFPNEPSLNIIDNKVGLQEYKIHHYGTSITPKKIFSLEYIDYPTNEINGYTDSELHTKTIENILFKLQNKFKLEYQEDIIQHGLKGKFFILEFKNETDREFGFVMGKLFRVKNRIYSVLYTGKNEKSVDPFMKSFRLLKSNNHN